MVILSGDRLARLRIQGITTGRSGVLCFGLGNNTSVGVGVFNSLRLVHICHRATTQWIRLRQHPVYVCLVIGSHVLACVHAHKAFWGSGLGEVVVVRLKGGGIA